MAAKKRKGRPPLALDAVGPIAMTVQIRLDARRKAQLLKAVERANATAREHGLPGVTANALAGVWLRAKLDELDRGSGHIK